MKMNHTAMALLVFTIGGLLVGSYEFGLRQAASQPQGDSAAAEADKGAGVVSPMAELPRNHPPLTQPVTRGARTAQGGPGAALPTAAATMPVGQSAPQSDPSKRGDAPFSHFRVGNRNVKSIVTDGPLVWIGSSGGVIRYDTRDDSHRLFDNKVPGLLSNGVFHISKLGDLIAVGTYGGGLSLYDPVKDQWRNINIPQGLADQFVYEVLKVGNGDVWIATWSGANRVAGGRFDDPKAWTTFTVENTEGGLPNPWVYGIEEGRNGDIWFATEEGLALYRQGKWRHWKHSDGLGAPYDVVKDAIKFTNDPAKASRHHAQQKSAQGLGGVKVAYNPNYIISLVVDRDGIVWCGTWGGGLARFDGEHWKNLTTADGLPSNHIFMLHLDDSGRLWAGTSGGLVRFDDDKKGFRIMTRADGLFADNVFSMDIADDGALWIGSFGGVARIARPHG